MKIRSNFVSNSSSSSFVIMTTKANHERALNVLHPFIRSVVIAMAPHNKKFNNEDVVLLGYMNLNDSSWDEYLDVEYDDEIPKNEYDNKMSFSDAFDEYCKEIKKREDKVVEFHQDG